MSRRDRARVDHRGRGPLGKIHVICDAESHAPKVVKIGRLDLVSDWGRLLEGSTGSEVVVSGVDTEFLVDDKPADGRELFDPSTKPPTRRLSPAWIAERLDMIDELTDERELFYTWSPSGKPASTMDHQIHRTRHRLECDLCGLRVDLRHETAREIAERLDMAGVSQVSLSGLAAILR